MTSSSYRADAVLPFVLLVGFATYQLIGLPLFLYHDEAWHIAAGDLIRRLGAIPRTDSWAFTSQGAPWYNISWLFDVLLSWLHQVAGYAGLYTLKHLMTALTAAIVYLHMRWRGVSLRAALFIVAMLLFAGLNFNALRPQLVTFLFAAITHLILHLGRERPRLLYVLPFLMIPWVNLHGGFIAGFILMGAYLAEAWSGKDVAQFKRLVFAIVTCGVALLVNPYSWEIGFAVLRTLDSVMRPYIVEWHALSPFAYETVGVYVFVFILVSNIRLKTVPLADKLIAFGWLALAFDAVRNFVLFTLLAAPYAALCLMQFKHERDRVFEKQIEVKKLRRRAWGLSVALMLAVAVISLSFRNEEIVRHNENLMAAVDYVNERHPNSNLFNDYTVGGKILYYARGGFRIFVDGRAGTAYSEQVLADYLKLNYMQDGWEEVLPAYGIEVIALEKNHPLILALERADGWLKAFENEEYAVLAKYRK